MARLEKGGVKTLHAHSTHNHKGCGVLCSQFGSLARAHSRAREFYRARWIMMPKRIFILRRCWAEFRNRNRGIRLSADSRIKGQTIADAAHQSTESIVCFFSWKVRPCKKWYSSGRFCTRGSVKMQVLADESGCRVTISRLLFIFPFAGNPTMHR